MVVPCTEMGTKQEQNLSFLLCLHLDKWNHPVRNLSFIQGTGLCKSTNPLNLSPKVPQICLCLSIPTDLDNFLDQMTHQDIEMALIISRFKHPTSMLQIVPLLKILQQYFQRAIWQRLSKFKMGMPFYDFILQKYPENENMRVIHYSILIAEKLDTHLNATQ